MFEKNKHYSPELEDAIIGACLIEKAGFSRVYDLLKKEMFYATENQVIYEALREMFENNLQIDHVTVLIYLTRNKGMAEINKTNTGFILSQKSKNLTSSAHLESHAILLKQMWLDREMISITNAGINPDKDGLEQLADLRARITELSMKTSADDWKDMSELMIDLYKHQNHMIATGGMGEPSGFPTIDRLYGGFHAGQMIVIAARPSVGKSALAGQIALNLAFKNRKVGIVSLEMKNNEIAARLSAIDTDTSFKTIYRALYEDEKERQRFYDKVSNSTAGLPIYVTDQTDVNVTSIKAKAMKLKQRHGLDVLIVDYLQLVGTEGNKNRNRENEVAMISRGFKLMAKDLDIPVLVLAQLNREADKRKGNDRFPQLSDLRESGAIEQDADAVMFLHSDYKSGRTEDENGNSTINHAHLIIRKWRNGDSNIIIDLDFDGPKMKFKEQSFIPISYSNEAPF